ncbi:unnamed protein product [Linum tenue]|uniref:Uncharacterized protein n=1 Tax=Linum tenue TaxID=586396 RepID=A0AAV0KQR4_9ROSI|nr:unnamed protein product [Linum tenue]
MLRSKSLRGTKRCLILMFVRCREDNLSRGR